MRKKDLDDALYLEKTLPPDLPPDILPFLPPENLPLFARDKEFEEHISKMAPSNNNKADIYISKKYNRRFGAENQAPAQPVNRYRPVQQQPIPQYRPIQQPVQQPIAQHSPAPEKPKKKKKHRFLKAIVSLFIVAVLLIGVLPALAIYSVVSSVDYVQTNLKENEYISSSALASSDKVTNILLLGVDGNSEGKSRSDSMILVSVDSKHKKIKLTSFLRDSWVYIPGKDKNSKLNSACSFGGPQLVADTIEYNFGIDIEHFVLVDFNMFTQIVDALGGVEVEVTEKEAKFINETTRHTIESGDNVLLNGAEALVYCRIRKLDTDYMRTFRQRKVITAILNKAKDTELTELIDAVKAVFPYIQTDMTEKEITKFAYTAIIALLTYDMQQTQAPIEEHFEEGTKNGQWVEIVDIEATKEYIYDFIYTDKYNDIQEEED